MKQLCTPRTSILSSRLAIFCTNNLFGTNMKFFCSFCNLECKSTFGLTCHTQEKHNRLTRNKLGLSDFPIRQDFEEFTMVHEDSNSLSSLANLKRPSSLHAPDKQAKRSRLALELEFATNESEANFTEPDESDYITDNESDEAAAYEPEEDAYEPDEAAYEQGETDYILREPNGGQVLDNEEARIRHSNFLTKLQWVPEYDANNPLHPWKHEGEIWLTDLLFRNGNISRTTADSLLGAFANGKISMTDGPIQFTNSREMLALLDVAARQGIVCSKNICYYVQLQRELLILFILFSLFKAKSSLFGICPKLGLAHRPCSFGIPLLLCKN